MLISEIEPIDKAGVNLLKSDNAEDVIDRIIELPLRKACKIFRKKGIETLMSSANKNNVLSNGEKSKEKEDIRNSFLPPLFDEAGRGYAWIMINFDTLSDENKDLLFSLEERKGINGEQIGEKAIWFVHPCNNSSIEFALKIGKYNYDDLRDVIPEEQIPKNIQVDEKLVRFEQKHILLSYNWGIYSMDAVFLRMPINGQTTVEEVEEYFVKFAESFKTQTIDKEKEEAEER